MTAQRDPVENPNLRWAMLAIAALAQLAMALNWFNISPALPEIATRLDFGVEGQSAAVSAFVIAFALLHIPGGILGARIGLKRAMLYGTVIQALGTVAAGFATDLTTLLITRFVAGTGASIITVVAIGAMAAWFHNREITLSLSVITGAAFTGGIAMAFYLWSYVQQAFGWTVSSMLAGALQLAVGVVILLAFRTPRGYTGLDGAERLDLAAIVRACRNRHVLLYGFGFMGAYGVYITVSQLLVPYALSERGLDVDAANLLGGVIALVGIPICLLGGWMADSSGQVRLIIAGFTALTALSTILIPIDSTLLLWIGGIGVTIFLLLAFPAWAAVPAAVARVPFDMVGSASGVMFTLSGIGGFVMPLLYGTIAGTAGYTTAWITLAVITALFGILLIFGGNARPSTRADDIGQGVLETERPR